MNNKTYVSTVSAAYEGTTILYAGNDIETAFSKVREHSKKYKMNILDYYVEEWESGQMIESYQYDDEEDEFIK